MKGDDGQKRKGIISQKKSIEGPRENTQARSSGGKIPDAGGSNNLITRPPGSSTRKGG